MKSLLEKINLIKAIKVLLTVAFILSMAACELLSGSDSGSETDPVPTAESKIIGTWAYDYGYNQDDWLEEGFTFNEDNTVSIKINNPSENITEEDKGTYKFIDDPVYGKTLVLNITSYKDNTMSDFADINVFSYLKYYCDDDNTMHIDRYKKDMTQMGRGVIYNDPPRENTYHRVVDGTKELLTSGKWRVNKIGTPDCDWDEQWTFNADGTMVDIWTDAGSPTETYNGTYEVIEKDGKNVLHHILDWETSQPEWWYEYKTLGPNLITVQLIESTKDGKVNNADINYYYRDVETETFTYHFANYTLDQTVPKANSYTLTNHPWQLNDYPRFFAGYEIDFLGWYNNAECKGSEVKTVTGNEREFWAKTGVRIKAKEERDNGAYYYGNNDFTVRAFSDIEKISAKKGDTITVYFEATVSKDYDASMGLDLTDYQGYSDFWTNCWHNVKSENKKIKTTFTFNIDRDINYENTDKIGFILAINSPKKDDEILFTDIKCIFLDEANSYNIAYKWGDVEYRTKGYKEIDFALPENAAFFDNFDWRIAQQELLGWYDNPELTGTPVTSIPKGNTSDKTYYAKFNFKGRYDEWEEKGVKQHDYHTTVPVRTLLSETKFNPKPGDTYNILFEATLSHDFNQWAGLQLQTDDNQYFQDFGNLETQNKKLSKVFTIKIPDNANLPSVDKLYFDFWYSDEACDEIVTFSDWKFVLLDETNSYNITYKWGDVEFKAKGCSEIDFVLPQDAGYFENYDWHFGNFELLGWYDNPELKGNPVTSITKGNTADKTYYAKFNIKIRGKNIFSDGINYNYPVDIPLKSVLPGINYIPKSGDTISIYFEATFANELNGWVSMTLVDVTNGDWNSLAQRSIKTSGKKISEVFNMKIDSNKTVPTDINNFGWNFCYNPETCDNTNTISNWKLILLDESNSYSIIYHFGNIEYEEKQLTAIKKILPDDMLYFENIDWNIGNNLLFGGWYDNPECTGDSLSTISANSIAAGGTKDVYLNLIPKMNTWTSDTDDGFNYNTTLPAKLFLSESSLNSIKNMTDTILVNLTATVKDSPILHENGWSWFTFIDSTDWSDVANTDSKQVSYSNGKINITYKLNKIDGKKLPDPEKMIFGMGFNGDFYGDRTKPIELYDITVVLLDETNSYNITYHYGNFSKTVKGLSWEKNELPLKSDELYSVYDRFAEPEFLGWYDNPEFNGNPVTSIASGNKADKEFWMKYNFRTCKREWDTAEGTKNHHWSVEIPLETVMPDFDVSKLKQNTTIKIKVTATPSVSSFNRYFLRLVDVTNNGWKDIAWTEEDEVLVDNKISHTFNLYVDTDASTSELKDILFGIGYGKGTYDQSITLSDWKFEVIE